MTNNNHPRLRSLYGLAWRQIIAAPLRSLLSVVAVIIGVAATIAVDVLSQAILSGLSQSDDVQVIAAGLFGQFEVMFGLVGGVVGATVAFMIFNAFQMSITQRRQQIGALRALGMTRRQVLRVIVAEALFLGMVGTVVGLGVGPALGAGVLYLLDNFGGIIFNALGAFALRPYVMVFAAVLGLLMTVIAVLLPAWQAARISPLEALSRPEVDETGGRSYRRRTILGLSLVVGLAVWLIISPPGEWVSYPLDIQLAALVLFIWFAIIALLMPGMIGWFSSAARQLLARWGGVTGRLTADNFGRDRSRITGTVATLVVGLAMIVGMTGIINGFIYELFGPMFEASKNRQAMGLFPFDLTQGVSSYAGLTEVVLSQETIDAARDELGDDVLTFEWYFVVVPELGFINQDYFSYMLEPETARLAGDWIWRFTEGDWEHALPLMKEGCGILAAPLIADRNQVGLYDTLTVTGPNGPVECVIAGIGQPHANATIISTTADLDPGPPMALIAQANPGVDREAVMRQLQSVADRFDGVYVVDLIELADLQFYAVDLVLQAMNGMMLLATLAAALGVINTTVMSVAARRHELGLLRAIGGTRRQVAAVVIGEAALIGLMGSLLGLITGLGMTIIFHTVYGGNAWGVANFDLWGAAWRSMQPALTVGAIGMLIAPLISAGAAWLPVRSVLRGSAIDTMDARRSPQPQKQAHTKKTRHLNLNGLVWRNLMTGKARAVSGALSVSMGVAVTIAADMLTSGILGSMGDESVMADFIGAVSAFISMTGLVVSAAAGFIVYNSLTMSVARRQQEIGSLRALGMTRRQVTRLILMEAAIIGLTGTVLGLLLGPVVGQGLLRVIEQTGLQPGTVSPNPVMLFLAIVFGIGVALLSGWLPARKAAHIPPIRAVRENTSSIDEKELNPLRLWVGAGLGASLILLIALAPPYHLMGSNLPHPLFMWAILFGLWGLVVLTFGLLLPALIQGSLYLLRSPARRVGGFAGRLASDNLDRTPGRVTMLALTFAIGIAIVLWTGGQVEFVNSLVTYNAERYLAELSWIITPINPDDALAQLNTFGTEDAFFTGQEIDAVLAATTGLAEVSQAYQVVVPEISAPVPGFVSIVVDPAYLQAPGGYTFTEGDWETALPILEAGCGLLVSSNVAGRLGGTIGEPVTIIGLDGPVTCHIAGIGSGGTLPVSFIGITAVDHFVKAGQQPDTLNIRLLPGADIDDLERTLDDLEQRYPGELYTYRSEEAIKGVLKTSDQLTNVFSLLQVLAVFAAALGVANTTLQSILERQKEIGLLRAVGATRRQVTRTILTEAMFTGLIGAVLGILLGSAMTLIYGFSVGGTGFGVDDLPVASTTFKAVVTSLRYGAVGIILSPLLAAAAAYFPARRILRGSALETMQSAHRQ